MQASGGDDNRRLGVVLTHLVPAMVSLGAGEISLASLCLAPRRVVPIRVPSSWRKISPVPKVEPELRGRKARHVLLSRADQSGEVVLRRGLRRRLRVIRLEGAPGELVATVRVGAGGEVV